jgi:hypothetical protein
MAVGKNFVVAFLISARHFILFGELVFGKYNLIIVFDGKCFRIIRNM